jgi:membrane fusion protein (multidrug efflux system)
LGHRPSLRTSLVATAIALVLAGLALFQAAPEPERLAAAGPSERLREVTTLSVLSTPIRLEAEVAGVLEPRRSVALFAETRGPVIEVGAEELDWVVAEQVLVRIDPLLATVALERAEAAVTRTESELALARSNLARRKSLSERGVASAAALEDAESAERVAAAGVRDARAERVRARDDLAKKTVSAPFTGVLRTFAVEVGEYLNEGQQLGELLDLSSARAKLGLSDREIVAVRSGQPVEVRVEAYPGEVFTGRIIRVGAASDTNTRKFPIEIEVANSEVRLLPGMVARVLFDLGEPVSRRLVPREATVDEFGLRFVWVIEREAGADIARRRRVEVRPLAFRPGVFELVSGLDEGTRIAVSDVRQLRDGESVRVRQASTP